MSRTEPDLDFQERRRQAWLALGNKARRSAVDSAASFAIILGVAGFIAALLAIGSTPRAPFWIFNALGAIVGGVALKFLGTLIEILRLCFTRHGASGQPSAGPGADVGLDSSRQAEE